MTDNGPLDAVVAALRASRRYGALAEDALRRVAEEALRAERGKTAAAIKNAKRRLHQACGAYQPARPRLDRLAQAIRDATDAELPGLLRDAMEQHASSRERLPDLERFWQAVRPHLGDPQVIVDLACGLQPLGFPWSGLPAAVAYVSVDVDQAALDVVGAAFKRLGVTHREVGHDLMRGPPQGLHGDVALLLKAVPCFETQRAGSGFALVENAPAPLRVVSFPTRTLSGGRKGFERTWSERFAAEAAHHGWPFERIELPAELVFVVRAGPAT